MYTHVCVYRSFVTPFLRMTWEEGSLRKTKGEEVESDDWGVQNVKERSGDDR